MVFDSAFGGRFYIDCARFHIDCARRRGTVSIGEFSSPKSSFDLKLTVSNQLRESCYTHSNLASNLIINMRRQALSNFSAFLASEVSLCIFGFLADTLLLRSSQCELWG